MDKRRWARRAGQALICIILCVLLPCLVTWWWQGQIQLPKGEPFTSGKYVRLEDGETVEDLEEYLVRLLPGQMDASFPEEALKAQAVLLRTWCLRKLDGRNYISEEMCIRDRDLSSVASFLASISGNFGSMIFASGNWCPLTSAELRCV